MLVLSQDQFGRFAAARFAETCAAIAAELSDRRPPDMDRPGFEAWITTRARAARGRYRLTQRRHLKLICYWELALGPDRFAAFRAGGMEAALDGQGSEEDRVGAALARLGPFLDGAPAP